MLFSNNKKNRAYSKRIFRSIEDKLHGIDQEMASEYLSWLDKKTYAPAATKGWLALVSYINDEDEVTNVCEGTNIKNDKNHYMNRKQITGDLHAHAPLLWCATELLTK